RAAEPASVLVGVEEYGHGAGEPVALCPLAYSDVREDGDRRLRVRRSPSVQPTVLDGSRCRRMVPRLRIAERCGVDTRVEHVPWPGPAAGDLAHETDRPVRDQRPDRKTVRR